MAKNLKINIKNAQIAEALNLKNLKKPELSKEKAVPSKKKNVKISETLESSAEAASQTVVKKPKVRIVSNYAEEKIEKAIKPEEAPTAQIEEAAPLSSQQEVESAITQKSPKEEEKNTIEETAAIPSEEKSNVLATGSQQTEPAAEKPAPSIKEEKKTSFKKVEIEEEIPKKKESSFKELKGMKKPEFEKFDARDRMGLTAFDEGRWRGSRKKGLKIKKVDEEIVRPKNLKITLPITVKDLAQEMKIKASEIIGKLFKQGMVVTLNDVLDDETLVQVIGQDFSCDITIDTEEKERVQITSKTIKSEISETDSNELKHRPPIITFMGHVDHGKTSLIDAIRSSNVAAGEAGAITQHIGAFYTNTPSGMITILDTPGHEAFMEMRNRGALVTDIVVLVVAGDEGIKEQTIEAINQAKAAKVPIVVAINKCDKPGFDQEKTYRQLADVNLLPEAWGGTTITVNCSALKKLGIKELLEMINLQAEILELKANPGARARGTILESELHKGMGVVATILIQNGTLNIGDAIVFGTHFGRVKTIHDQFGQNLKQATLSMPVKITGLSHLAEAGCEFIVVKNEKEAKEISEQRLAGMKLKELKQIKKGMESFLEKKQTSQKKILPVIIRADVQGSVEALKNSLLKIKSEKVQLAFVSEGVGEISESDVQLAAASKAVIIGFHSKIESHAETLIKELKVEVRLNNIIYHVVDDIKKIMRSLLEKIAIESDTGKALVKAIFKSSQIGSIAGCQVIEGTVTRNSNIRLNRKGEILWKGKLSSLKRMKEDTKEVQKGTECGIVLDGFSDIKEGDILEAFDITYEEQEL